MKTLIIAEAGVNHNGDVDRALDLVDAAADAGADIVKFQTFKATELATSSAEKAAYQKALTGAGESQSEMLSRLELDEAAHLRLIDKCESRKIEFLSTAFDLSSLELLLRLPLCRFKVPSGEIHNVRLLSHLASTGKPIILSTGMCALPDVWASLGVLACRYVGIEHPRPADFMSVPRTPEGHAALAKHVTVLHCTSEYPAPLTSINLAAMTTMREELRLPIGYSDHSLGISVSLGAVALGATVIEKHLTLDRTLQGPDHKASLEPKEFGEMVRGIREIEIAIGRPEKAPSSVELENANVVRKSLVALTPIRRGQPFTEENIGAKRPGSGVSPLHYWEYIGKLAGRDYDTDQQVDP